MNELNETLKEISKTLQGIKEELNYMNGVQVMNDGTRLSRDAMKHLTSNNIMKSASR